MLGGFLAFVGLAVSLLLHETGHYLSARATGMSVTAFFVGFGPRIWSTQRGDTEFGIRAVPIGGYVRVAGMDPLEELEQVEVGQSYVGKRFWQKSVFVLSGVVLHFILGFSIFTGVFWVDGIDFAGTGVERVVPGSPAEQAGIQPGDRIVAIDSKGLDRWDALTEAVQQRPGESVSVTVERDRQPFDVQVELGEDADGFGLLGVWRESELVHQDLDLTGAFRLAGETVGDSVAAMANLFAPATIAQVADAIFGDPEGLDLADRPVSPIGIVNLGGQLDPSELLLLMAGMNIALGFFNGLPFLPLDGGHFAVAVYERISGRKANIARLIPVTVAVVVLFLFLGISAIYLDIINPIMLGQ